MKRANCLVVFSVLILLLLSPQTTFAGGGHSGFVVGTRVYVGPGFWGPRPWWPRPWWGPGWYVPRYYVAPPVIVQQPPVYLPPAPLPQEPQYWFYCQDAQGYYPYVQTCPNGWTKVSPSPPPGQ
jgi:hypothetical protein